MRSSACTHLSLGVRRVAGATSGDVAPLCHCNGRVSPDVRRVRSPLGPPPRAVGTAVIGAERVKISIKRTNPCRFYAAWVDHGAHSFIRDKDGCVDEIVWDPRLQRHQEKVIVVKGLMSWHATVSQTNNTLGLTTENTEDLLVWKTAQAHKDIENS